MSTANEQPKMVVRASEVYITKKHLLATGIYQLFMARADILAVVQERHGADFVRRVAWEITDPEDRKGLNRAARAYGKKEVIKKIAERTSIAWKCRTTDTRYEVEIGEVEVGGGCKIRITHTIRWVDKIESYILERMSAM